MFDADDTIVVFALLVLAVAFIEWLVRYVI